ncbi:Heterochromatin-associated protein HP1, CHROMO domain protein [Pseudoloma neurophilia]|uniref:Heterochromatin-associated protein HP1, CHROMO domain protein n=1 Tax=Pseudoloma neurophilia TaxID=146866 RepID=A0A0R0M0Q4_9MICR|nr:Heterochromatin-associated protein HP1, CHROMO domain protein [Pseudoloma neurophilia]
MSEENIFNVERIVDSRIYKGKKQYLIKWEGFDDKENTWEAAKDILCKDLINEFEKSKKSSKVSSTENKKILNKKLNLDISNEWHNDVTHIESVYKDEKTHNLMCDLIFKNGSKLSMETQQVYYKCPIRLLEYYEKNINFVDEA